MHLLQSRLQMPTPADTFGDALPIGTDDDGPPLPLHQILHTTQSGTIGLVTPVSESSYRRLSNLAAYLAHTLDPRCGLNPRAFRAGDSGDGGWDAGTGARGVLDGTLLMRLGELSEPKKREGLSKYGGGEWEIWGEREVLAGWGLFGQRGW